ncbi:hypothetical protein [Streptomyces sp. adm13(2018)]|uniref:hypothetical protein n=1 Tax=Streptomyces sp. adm13(2018) TaxID=2479007 RepID=UPI0016509106|nr:hypothetical protein [Streptomyces sp. adm13(2018)]
MAELAGYARFRDAMERAHATTPEPVMERARATAPDPVRPEREPAAAAGGAAASPTS